MKRHMWSQLEGFGTKFDRQADFTKLRSRFEDFDRKLESHADLIQELQSQAADFESRFASHADFTKEL